MIASAATANRMSAPRTASSANWLMPSQRSRLVWSVWMSSAPSRAPNIEPAPPKMLTPPTTAAATTWSSRPVPLMTVMLPNLPSHMKPPRPAIMPLPTKARNTSRRMGRPATRAASGLEPMANSRRP